MEEQKVIAEEKLEDSVSGGVIAENDIVFCKKCDYKQILYVDNDNDMEYRQELYHSQICPKCNAYNTLHFSMV
ncbi:MAG: hypothetical protein LBM59_03410 [Ruminococcus sp.]|jgi:ribosomal protein L40E|nr:hypothetical protein [Ruminococcus sp.]